MKNDNNSYNSSALRSWPDYRPILTKIKKSLFLIGRLPSQPEAEFGFGGSYSRKWFTGHEVRILSFSPTYTKLHDDFRTLVRGRKDITKQGRKNASESKGAARSPRRYREWPSSGGPGGPGGNYTPATVRKLARHVRERRGTCPGVRGGRCGHTSTRARHPPHPNSLVELSHRGNEHTRFVWRQRGSNPLPRASPVYFLELKPSPVGSRIQG